jgi:hypothetical protein
MNEEQDAQEKKRRRGCPARGRVIASPGRYRKCMRKYPKRWTKTGMEVR